MPCIYFGGCMAFFIRCRRGTGMISRSMKIRNSLLLVLTALIWGVAFVAQSKGGDAVGALSFNCIRSIIAGIVLLPVIKLLDALGYESGKENACNRRYMLWIGIVSCKYSSADRNNHGYGAGKSRFFNRLLHTAGSGIRTFPQEEMWF